MPALADALFARFYSRQDESFSAKVIAALRSQFGGHATRPLTPSPPPAPVPPAEEEKDG